MRLLKKLFGKQKDKKALVTYSDSQKEKLSHIRGFDSEIYDKTKKLIIYAEGRGKSNPGWLLPVLESKITGVSKDKYREVLLNIVSEDMNTIETHENFSSACNKGCYYCCKQVIYVNEYEAADIIRKLQNLTSREKRRIREKAKEIRNTAVTNGIPLYITLNNISDEEEINKRYLKLDLECPLLSEDKLCSIYNYRPMTCATFRNYGKPNDCNGQIAPHCKSFQDFYVDVYYQTMMKDPQYSSQSKIIESFVKGERLFSDVIAEEL